ncbi:ubiquitin-conjugating enzyme e2 5b-like [Anaeramoeba flamelloides]|uniref:Ubiquitin-conjugating enzyme e2 5b-like n=1 Tax=Anaeramoeba flamelloides TaxID=1746091 RepID=A0ABQ8YHG8_9EUKA|nr:ubiquitin-conjugating enzyme e2 5b-like [Anaeramoeba flamelloides]
MAQGRLGTELVWLNQSPIEGVTAGPKGKDLNNWVATIIGPNQTPYEGGKFKLNIKFPTDYPFKAPTVTFTTKLYHPNVTEEGNICLAILDNEWAPSVRIIQVLEEIVEVFKHPNVDHPAQPQIAVQYKDNRSAFNKEAKNFTKKYAK